MDHRVIKTLLTTVVQGPSLGLEGDYLQYLCEHGGTQCDLLTIRELLMPFFMLAPVYPISNISIQFFKLNKLTWPLVRRSTIIVPCEVHRSGVMTSVHFQTFNSLNTIVLRKILPN